MVKLENPMTMHKCASGSSLGCSGWDKSDPFNQTEHTGQAGIGGVGVRWGEGVRVNLGKCQGYRQEVGSEVSSLWGQEKLWWGGEPPQSYQCSWQAHFLKNFLPFVVIYIVKGFGVVNKAEVDVFLELSCFFDEPADVGNLISGSPAFSKTSLNI